MIDRLQPSAAQTITVSDLVSYGTTGRLRIPSFQRQFRWDARDIERLFDSIWRGYPIGSLLLWEKPAPAARLEIGPVEVMAAAVEDGLWVVDGQQRLFSLVGVLASPGPTADKFDLYFDLNTETFRRPGRSRVPRTWLPLRTVLGTEFFDWVLQFREEGGTPDQVDLTTLVAKRIREHEVPASVVRTQDESVVRDIFDRVNGYGHRLRRSEVFHALHASFGQNDPGDLPSLIGEVGALGFGSLAEDTVLQSVLALRGSGDVYREFRQEFAAEGDDPAAAFRLVSQAIARVVVFLRTSGIPHVSALPYSFVIPVLVRFLHLFPEPSERSRVLLRRWLWRGAVGTLAAGGVPTALLRRAVQAVHEDDEDGSVQRLLAQFRPPAPINLDLDAVALNRAAARMNIALLASLDPRDLVSGAPVEVADVLDRLDDIGLLRVPNAHPRLAGLLLHPELDDERLSVVVGRASPETLASHGIDAEAARSLATGDVAGFARSRADSLREALSKALDRMLEVDATDRPPIAALVVSDDAPR